ncbi:hypothetical protein FPI77_11100 [Klebsiella quasivariicola]|nr:hypothetical protein B8P98_14025 [Klebsiella quasivariicola]MBK2370904.1 hypothetical protein [Klebsiella quasivariicola]NBZ76061.1 hypothetical protein [Klebsiella quasivariicola]QBL49504.1 hypothetical protein BMD99_013740 [Klebsiella sp. PO552]TTN49915.1 hypothetical protein FPI77_11100 [Klebsiella quasivariicola]
MTRLARNNLAIPLILIYINTLSAFKLHFTARLFWQGVYDIGFTTWIFFSPSCQFVGMVDVQRT